MEKTQRKVRIGRLTREGFVPFRLKREAWNFLSTMPAAAKEGCEIVKEDGGFWIDRDAPVAMV